MADESPYDFEEEVRRAARAKWPGQEASGAELIDGRERDGIFVTDECVHLLECTTSRKKEKAQSDLEKLAALYKRFRKSHPHHAVKCWFITRDEPTADQRACRNGLRDVPIEAFNLMSLATFQAKMFDALGYLDLRARHRFGSIHDPNSGDPERLNYIDVGFRRVGQQSPITLDKIVEGLLDGQRLVMLGEYGAGKSMTLREIYRRLAALRRRDSTLKVPVFINLREHQGQVDPAEILERHARSIGFSAPSSLVRAWKAGYVILLLDGFDEVSSLGLQGAWRRLRDVRFGSMSGVRGLVDGGPAGTGIAIAGREQFFDTDLERRRALALDEKWDEIRLDEFNDDQIRELVRQYGYQGEIPAWIPARPLLIATLFAKRGNSSIPAAISALSDSSAGWELLLQEVCERESKIERGISGENIRSILESLATLARTKDSGLGPLLTADITRLFEKECGYQPDDAALVVLQRLPGIGRDPSGQDEARSFVDTEFADACRAGDVSRFALSPFGGPGGVLDYPGLIMTMGETGVAVAARQLGSEFSAGQLAAALQAAERAGNANCVLADLISISIARAIPLQHDVSVREVLVNRLEIPAGRKDLGRASYQDCYFSEVCIPTDVQPSESPYFSGCFVQTLDGRISERDLPYGRFIECVIDCYVGATAGAPAARSAPVPIGVQVLLSVLKKLFVQSLSGRKESAFFRGLDPAHQQKVEPVLELVRRHGFAVPVGRGGDPVWVPTRRNRARAMAVLDGPSTSMEALVQDARKV